MSLHKEIKGSPECFSRDYLMLKLNLRPLSGVKRKESFGERECV